MKTKSTYSIFLLLLLSSLSFSQKYELEDIIVSDKFKNNEQSVVQNVRVITKEQIKRERSLEDAIRSIPGMSIRRSSAVSSLSYRGMPSQYSLILLNGQRLTDSSSINDTISLSNIDMGQVERIEVLNGANSVLYGSGAVASVINIITSRYENSFSLIKGERLRGEGRVHKTLDSAVVSSSVFYEENHSLSVVQNGDEKDLVISKGLALGLDMDLFGGVFSAEATKNEGQNQIDGYLNFALSDVQGLKSKRDLESVLIKYEGDQIKVSSFYTKQVRSTLDLQSNTLTFTEFNSNSLLNVLEYKLNQNIILGLNHELQKAKIDQRFERNTYSYYALGQKSAGELSFSLGLRLESSDDYKSKSSRSFGTLWQITNDHSLRFNYSFGFKAPSFYQLYHQNFGNADLEVEENEVLDLSYQYKDNLKLSVFKNHIHNAIGFSTKYLNQDKLLSQGVEVSYNNQLRLIDYEVSAVLLVSEKNEKNIKKTSFPKETYSLSLGRDWEEYTSSIRFDHISERFESTQRLSAYNLVSATVSRKFGENKLFLRGYNLLNQSYQESAGFSRPGRVFELEMKFNF